MNTSRKNFIILAAVLGALVAGIWIWNSQQTPPPAPEQTTEDARPEEAASSAQEQEMQYMSELPRLTVTESEKPLVAPETNASVVRGNATEKEQRTDPVVSQDFVRDLARLCATNYHPAGTRHNTGQTGITTLTFKKLNMHYGVNLTGLTTGTRDVLEARSAIFNHLLSPIVLRMVYDIYSDEFVSVLAEEALAQTREYSQPDGGYAFSAISQKDARELLALYGDLVQEVGSCFQAFAKRSDLVEIMARYTHAARRVTDSYGAYADLEAQDAPQYKLDRVSAEIKKALTERDKMRAAIIAMTSPIKNRKLLSEGDIMDIATWISRRIAGNQDNLNAIGAIASLSFELADALRGYTLPAAATANADS